MSTQFPVKRIFWIVLTVMLIVWIGVGLYFLSTKSTQSTKQSAPSLSFEPFPSTTILPNEAIKTVEGVYTHLNADNNQFTLQSEDQTFIFTLPPGAMFFQPDTRLKVYYQKKGSKFNFVGVKIL